MEPTQLARQILAEPLADGIAGFVVRVEHALAVVAMHLAAEHRRDVARDGELFDKERQSAGHGLGCTR